MDTIKLDPATITSMKSRIKLKLPHFKNNKILVVGDVGVDEYIHGDVSRISPEAPVPVLNVQRIENRLGLAANVAKNITNMDGQCTLLSVLGDDSNNKVIQELCSQNKVTTHFIADSSRPTTIKTRVIHEAHHIVRVDKELKKFISKDLENKILEQVKNTISSYNIVIIEDYSKGVITEAVCQGIIALCKAHSVPVLIDPHLTTPAHFYKGADLLKPNINEVFALLKIDKNSINGKAEGYFNLADRLKTELKLNEVLLTLGKEGMAILADGQLTNIPTLAKQVYDVTGAGDTVIAALALAKASGLGLVESSYLANLAAGIVVSKVGTVSCRLSDLHDLLNQ